MAAAAPTIRVFADGRLTWRDTTLRCVLGRGGVVADKREGDGGTPAGRFPLRRLFYRRDRLDPPDSLVPPPTGLPVRALRQRDGWCDDPADPAYNRLIEKPFSASHEDMWRSDGLYDLVVELGYNDDPVVPGRGSAIFMHLAKPDYAPTEGCIALRRSDLLDLLRDCTPDTEIEITPPAP